ncbi:MAG TPA: glycosyltransferase family 4 protein [Bacteroidota bacterium]
MNHHTRFRILHTCFSASWGGLEIQALDEALLIAEKGHDVTLACLPDTPLFQEASGHKLNVLPLKVRGYFHPQAIWKLRQFLQRAHVDLVHSQLSKDIATVAPALKLCPRDIPLILSRRMGSGISKKDLFHRFTYSRISRVLAISSVIRENVAQTTPVAPERIITVHHGIDTARFSADKGNRVRLRKEFGIAENTIVVGFVGRFSPGKGHEEFLSAAATLTARFSDLHFVIVGKASRGEEEYEAEIKALSRSLGLEPATTFTGFRNDVPEIMSVFDVFAFPSHAEAFGAVLVEAMAMKLPVVASRSDGVLDIVIEDETGLLVPPKDSSALAEGLAFLIQNPEMREKMGQAGRVRAEKMFSRESLGKKLLQVYETVLQERSQ